MEGPRVASRLAAVFILLLVAPAVAAAQGAAQGWDGFAMPSLQSFSSSLGGENFRIRPSAEMGYQKIHFDLKFPDSHAQSGFPAPLDFEVPSATMLVGGLGLEVEFAQRLSLFIKFKASSRQDVLVRTPEQPMANVFLTVGRQPYDWTGSRCRWSTLDAAGAWAKTEGWALVAGVKQEKLSMALADPRDRDGNPVNYSYVPLPPDLFFTYTALQDIESDFSAKLLYPYVGLTMVGPQYRFSLTWSPLAWADVTIPLRGFSRADVLLGPVVFLRTDVAGDFRYALRKPGGMIGGEFSYDVNVGEQGLLNFWFAAAWADIKCQGAADSNIQAIFQLLPPIGPAATVSNVGTNRSTAHLTWSRVAGGITAALRF